MTWNQFCDGYDMLCNSKNTEILEKAVYTQYTVFLSSQSLFSVLPQV